MGGVFADVGAETFEGLGMLENRVVEPFLPGKVLAVEIPSDPLGTGGLELADDCTERS